MEKMFIFIPFTLEIVILRQECIYSYNDFRTF